MTPKQARKLLMKREDYITKTKAIHKQGLYQQQGENSQNAQVRSQELVDILCTPRFPQQRSFIVDPARLKAIFCTRRAAKSFTVGLYMVHEALTYPGSNILFIGLTRQTASDIIVKDILQVINRTHDLGMKFNKATLDITFPNGSVIKITGVDADENTMNKLLGKKYRLVCIDEASMYTVNVRHLVYDILGPAMADLDGTICLTGTSSNFTRGLFYDITTGKEPGWSLHQWTAHDNPYVDWQKILDRIALERPLYRETPQYKQWYLNQWVVDEGKLVYKFNEERNLYTDLPYSGSKGWTFNLSCDTGWEDDNAFVLSGYHENDPTLYIIKTFKKNHMTFDQVEAKLKEMSADPRFPIRSVIIDGANKQGVETMRLRSDIYFEYADKLGKVDHIEMCNGDLIQGRIKIQAGCTDLVDELMSLVWKTDGDKIRLPKKEHPALPNHLCDAFLYGWFNGYHFLSSPAVKALLPGTPEYVKQQEDLHKQAIIERIKRDQALKDGSPAGWTKTREGKDPWHDWD
jgi:hypothetical protein